MSVDRGRVKIRLLAFEGCPGAPVAHERIRKVLAETGIEGEIQVVRVESAEEAARTGFLGSPTVQVDGMDIQVERRGEPSLFGCRLYPGGNAPPEDMIREALYRAASPKRRILYLCSGNSCRSQMAEAWTRVLWGDLFEAYSAGLEPKGLDARALAVMREVGVDMASHRSKAVTDLPEAGFDVVVTVCDRAREECPIFPGVERQLHRSFEDPPLLAASAATEAEA